MNIVAGGERINSGDILLYNKSIKNMTIREKKELNISNIPEDRIKQGLFLPFTIADNIVCGRHYKKPFVNNFQIRLIGIIKDFAREMIKLFDIRCTSEEKIVGALSGGNQQKVIIARELSSNPDLILAFQPTRGVDVGAIEFIHKKLIEERMKDKAVLLVSADLDEVISLSDRIGVLYKGKIIKEFEGTKISKEEIGYYMTGEKHEN